MAVINCRGCGAALPPDDDSPILRCAYCGQSQPAPDHEARRERAAREAQARAAREERRRDAEEERAERAQVQRAERRSRLWQPFRTLGRRLLTRVVVIAVVLAALTATGWVHVGLLATGWDGKTPYRCEGIGRVRLAGVQAEMPGTAIETGRFCWVTVENGSRVVADTAAVVTGWGRLTLKGGGTLVGRKAALVVDDQARVRIEDGQVQGPLRVGGRARIEGPVWDGRSSVSCTGEGLRRLSGVRGELAPGASLAVAERCELQLDELELRAAAGPMLQLRDHGVVYVTGGRLESQGVLAQLTDDARLVNNRAVLVGKLRRSGRARLEGPAPTEPPAREEAPQSPPPSRKRSR